MSREANSLSADGTDGPDVDVAPSSHNTVSNPSDRTLLTGARMTDDGFSWDSESLPSVTGNSSKAPASAARTNPTPRDGSATALASNSRPGSDTCNQTSRVKMDETDDTPEAPTANVTSNISDDVKDDSDTRKVTCKSVMRALLCSDASKVVITRVLYLLHTLLTIWRVAEVLGDRFWAMAALTATFIVDMLFIIVKRKGREWTW